MECCGGVPDPADIFNSTFTDNGIALGGYAGNDVIVVDSLFQNNETAVARADKVITGSVFIDNTYGLFETERIDVYDSSFTGHEIALFGGRGVVEGSTITGNVTGVKGFFEGFTLSENTITNNDVGVVLTESSGFTAPVECNDIFANATYNAKVTGASNKSAPNNWWGTTDAGAINAKIFDAMDDASLGLLNYVPFLVAPFSSSPVCTGASVDLGVTKAGSPDPVVAGEQLTYTVTVSNNDSSTATGVTVTDTLPGGVSFDSSLTTQGSYDDTTGEWGVGTLTGGQTGTLTIVVTVNTSTTGPLANTAIVEGDQPDDNPGDNSATATTTVVQLTCAGVPATIVGTPGDDVLVGTSGNDVIVGREGDDVLVGLGGSDRLCGGPGDDMMSGGGGTDWLLGQAGNDMMSGDDGGDLLIGSTGNDMIRGGDSADFIHCGLGTDFADGGLGAEPPAPTCEFQANIP